MTLEEVKILIEAETKQFKDEIKSVKAEMEKASKDINKSASSIKGFVGKIGKAFMKLVSITALVSLGKQAIALASNLQEVQNVVNVAFGSMAYKMEEFAKKSIKNFGLSELSAKKYGSTFMSMARGLGLSSDLASDMSLELTGLIGDASSFYNTTQDIAQTKLASIFTGETESLKEWGIVMTQANLQAFALKLGIDKQISSMSQAELVMLRYKYVTEQLSLAQGDFSRTSGSWANQLRILQENFKQLLSIIGSGLIKVLTPVIQVINMIISKFVQLAQVVQGVLGRLFGKGGSNSLPKQMEDTSSGASGISDGINDASKATEKATKKAKAWKNVVMGFDVANVVGSQEDAGGSSGSSGSGVGGASLGASDFGIDFEDFGNESDGMMSKIDEIADKVTSLLKNTFTPIIEGIKKEWEDLCTIFSGLWDKHGERTLKNITEFKDTTIELFKTLYSNIIEPVFKPLCEALENIWNNTIKGLIKEIGDFVFEAVNGIMELWNQAIAPLLSWLSEKLKPLWENTWDSIGQTLENVCGMIGEWIGGTLDVLKGLIDFVVGVFTGDWQRAWNGIKGIFDGFKRILSGLVDGLCTEIKNYFSNAWENIKAVFEITGVSTFFSNVWNNVKGAFSNVSSWFSGKFGNAWTSIKNAFSYESVKTYFSNRYNDVKNAFNNANTWLGEKFGNAWSNVKSKFSTSSVKTYFGNVYSGIKDVIGKVPNYFKEKFDDAWSKVKKVFSSSSVSFKSITSSVGKAFQTIVNKLIDGMNSMISKPFEKLNGIIKDIKKTKFLGLQPFESLPTLPTPKIPKLSYYDRGGFLKGGELAVVNERGPELLGKMGTKNTVANNTQITNGIKQGVIEAMMYVMSRYIQSQDKEIHIHNHMPDGSIQTFIKKYNEYMRQTNGEGGFVL